MHPAVEQHIPDGLLAASVLLAENSRQGSATYSSTPRWASSFAISHTSLGIIGPLYDSDVESRCTGKERDAETGLDFFGARYYGSSMGRWLSPDPGWFLASDISDPQSMNQYSYVNNNPLIFVDLDGMHYDCTTSTTTYKDSEGKQHTLGTTGKCNWVDDPIGNRYRLPPRISIPSHLMVGPQLSAAPQSSSSQACINPTVPQKIARSAYGYIARKLGMTFGAGLGASGGAGAVIGIGGSASALLVASPDGTSGLAVTLPAMPTNLMASGPQGSLAAGIIGGSQVSISNAQTIQDLRGSFYGAGFGAGRGEAGGLDFAGGYNSSGRLIGQLNGTIGFGAGGFGAAGQKTNTTIKPFCK